MFCLRSQRIKTIRIDDKILKLQLWDTAGQERFRSIIASYYRGAHAVLIVYDITNAISFHNVEKWHEEAAMHMRSNGPMLLVGNKADNERAREVSGSEGRLLAARLGMQFVETSAKTDIGVDRAFHTLASQAKTTREIAALGETRRENRHVVGPSVRIHEVKERSSNFYSPNCCSTT